MDNGSRPADESVSFAAVCVRILPAIYCDIRRCFSLLVVYIFCHCVHNISFNFVQVAPARRDDREDEQVEESKRKGITEKRVGR